MEMLKVKIQRLDNSLPLPSYKTPFSAGMDLYSRIDVVLKRGEITLVPTGIAISLPEGYEAQIRPRSGLALKHGLTLLNTPGTIDADYRGEIALIMINVGKEDFVVEKGMRLAQMVITRYEKVEFEEVDALPDSQRGTGGFGSTGI
ncbi:MAG: dUTP diphosphatase [Bacillota bacterium]|nr:dUTP diphosphatase [Bacillota bacterium]NLU55319.1 dUTP diphosphatase [Bacillota bacterium]HOA90538.1 dUTP diphosphatase [Bacillota bacterium]HOL13006.1 dUTP diphosphatase [Bacillota bacterium]HOP53495.1 dUTP diphosphatase [Bacillota bacterium]